MSPFERAILNNTEQLISPRDLNISVSGAHMTMDDRSNSPISQALNRKNKYNSFRKPKKSISIISKGDVSINDMVNSTIRKPAFGFEGYHAPNNEE